MSLLNPFRAKRSFPSSYIPSREALASMPSLDRRQIERIERAMERGRARVGSLADNVTAERIAELIEELRDEAAPVFERALPIIEKAARRRRRGRGRKIAMATLGLLGLAGVVGVVAYLFWPGRDEEPAYLMDVPDAPNNAPAGMPPAGGPADSPHSSPDDEAYGGYAPTAQQPTDARADHELASTGGARDDRNGREAPHATYVERFADDVPSSPALAPQPFASSPAEPNGAHRPWLPR